MLVLVGFSASAQNVLENNAPSLKWYQVNTSHFKVLFPAGFESQAQRTANTLEHLYHAEAHSLGTEPKKISVILQNQSSVSNGFVSILPRRSEFYTMPAQDYNFIGTNDWLTLLASHEYRHVVQYQHATRGFNKFLYLLFGSPTLAGMAQVSAPQWFWEGDAVVTETAFTQSGRGRIPNFGLVFRTNLLEGREFNYHKQYLRSYKHNIPDHYVLGYHMVSYLRRRTNDAEIWGKISARSWSVPFIPFAFSNAIKKESGLYVTDLYKAMAADFKKEWQNEIDQLQLTPFEQVTQRSSKAYTDYLYPQPMEDGRILVMKRGIGDIAQFVFLKDGKEQKAFIPGVVNSTGMISVAGNKVLWNEYGYNPRWRVKTYSLIKAYDTYTGEKRIVGSRHERYAGSALSPDGYQVVTVRSGTDYQHRLLILDYFSGKVMQEFANPGNDFLSMPRWSDDGQKIVVLKTTPGGKAITIIDVATGIENDVLSIGEENVGYPVVVGNYLLFNSPYSGIDNIDAIDLETNQRFQVTCSKYGAYNPGVSRDRRFLYYNEQTRDGMDVVKVEFNPSGWQKFDARKPSPSPYQHLVDQEGRPAMLDSIPDQSFVVTPYSKMGGLINPYSWGFLFNSSLTGVDLGIASRDILSTTSLSAGYKFDINERTGSWHAGVSYQGWYPIIDVNFSAGNRSVNEGDVPTQDWLISRQNDTTFVNAIKNVTFSWNEKNLEAGFRLPLITTQSKYLSAATVGNYVGYTHVSDFKNSETTGRYFPAIVRYDTVTENGNDFARRTIMNVYPFFDYVGNGNLFYNRATLSAYRLLKTSRRDIYSKWGQAVDLTYYSTPYGGDLQGGLFSFIGQLYFPGLFKHHSVHGYWAYQADLGDSDFSEAYDDYLFRNTIPVPRGQSVSRFQKFYSMSANYTMPVWYPDIALGPILNIQRVRATAFADYGYGQFSLYRGVNSSYLSVGGELKFDINIMRFLPQLDVGVRYSYGISPAVTKFEILIGTFNF